MFKTMIEFLEIVGIDFDILKPCGEL